MRENVTAYGTCENLKKHIKHYFDETQEEDFDELIQTNGCTPDVNVKQITLYKHIFYNVLQTRCPNHKHFRRNNFLFFKRIFIFRKSQVK